MIAQVVFIHRNIQFAIGIKQALERTGNYEVRVFTSGETAAEALAQQNFQVAVVDFDLPEGGEAIVRRLRAAQPDLALIATPRQPADVIQQLGLQGSIAAAFQARDLIPVIHRALEGRRVTRGLQRPPLRPGEISTDPEDYLRQAGSILKTRPSGDDPIATIPGTRPASGRAPEAEYVPLEQIFDRGAGTLPAAPPEDPDILIEPDVTEGTPQFRPGISFDDLFQDMDEGAGGSAGASVFPLHPGQAEDDHPPPDFPSFDEVLGTIEPDSSPRRETDTFNSLVNSMRAQEAPKPPLPSRQQPMVEFTLSSGMDDLLAQIQESRRKTDHLVEKQPAVDADVFSKLAEEEPPLPEGEGTISDLVVGVTDPGFQQVMAALRGEEPPPVDAPVAYSSAELQEAFSSYYDSHPEALSAAERAAHDAAEPRPPRDPLLAEVDALLASVEAEMRDQPPPAASDSLDTPARLILELEQMLDPTRPLDTFSISELIDSIESQLPAHRPQVQPLPSWVQELRRAQQSQPKSERGKRRKGERRTERTPASEFDAFGPSIPLDRPPAPHPHAPDVPAAPPAPVNEFDFDTTEFLAGFKPEQMLDEAAASRPDSYDLTTLQHDALPATGDAETMALPPRPGQPPSLPEADEIPPEFLTVGAVSQPEELDWDTGPLQPLAEPPIVEDDTSDYTQPLPVEDEDDAVGGELLVPDDRAPAGWQPLVVDDPLIAQISLSLMNVSLESIVEAALLTRDNQIVAFAGSMAREDIEALRQLFHDEWTVPAGGGVKMKFFTLESSGRDYMLYGRRTEHDLCLWLIVPGSTHLADIKAQSRKLIEALQSVPETPPEPIAPDEAVAAVETAVERQPYAYVWTLRDPAARLAPPVAQAIRSGMRVQLGERAWQIDEIRAEDDFVYILAQVPDDTPPYEVIRDLKRRSAEIVREIARRQNQRLDPASLWADSYLIVTPGRPLDMEEIQEYIRFERML
jgi:REP element-mobilizing transposase RayT/CheY-like chemotaxis protein